MRRTSGTVPERVGDLLTKAVPGLVPRLLQVQIRHSWPELVGRDAARHAAPHQLANGVLHVVVSNSPWLQELTLRSEEILAALSRRYGGGVGSLRFSMGQPERPDPAPAPRPAHASRLTSADHSAIEEMVAPVRDPEIAGALRRLLARDRLERGTGR